MSEPEWQIEPGWQNEPCWQDEPDWHLEQDWQIQPSPIYVGKAWGQCHKTFFVCELRISVLS
jgi:hypothetical protein